MIQILTSQAAVNAVPEPKAVTWLGPGSWEVRTDADADAANSTGSRRDKLTLGELSANSASAFLAARTRMTKGEVLSVPPGEHSVSAAYAANYQIEGQSKAAVLKAAAGAPVVLRLGRHTPLDWDFHGVRDITIDGNNKAANGVDFESQEPGGTLFGGRWSLNRVTIKNCNVGINQASGNIGNRYRDVHVRACNIGVRHVNYATGVMHAGAVMYEGGEMSMNALAAIYINDSQDGLGQYDFRNLVIEGNPGFGIFINLNNIVPACGVVFDNVWLEANASAASVTIDGVSYTPRDVRLMNARPVEFRSCYLRSVDLVNSTLIAKGCRIDDSLGALDLSADASSEFVCYDVFSNSQLLSPIPFVMSIAGNSRKTSAVNSGSWRGRLRSVRMPSKGVPLFKQHFNGTGPWDFGSGISATSVADGVLYDSCATITVPAGGTALAPLLDSSVLPAGKWVAWGGHIKLVSGSVRIVDLGGNGGERMGELYRKTGEWVCSFGIARVNDAPSATPSRLRIINDASGAPSTLRIADVWAVAFDTEADALEWANSGFAPK